MVLERDLRAYLFAFEVVTRALAETSYGVSPGKVDMG